MVTWLIHGMKFVGTRQKCWSNCVGWFHDVWVLRSYVLFVNNVLAVFSCCARRSSISSTNLRMYMNICRCVWVCVWMYVYACGCAVYLRRKWARQLVVSCTITRTMSWCLLVWCKIQHVFKYDGFKMFALIWPLKMLIWGEMNEEIVVVPLSIGGDERYRWKQCTLEELDSSAL